MPVPRRPAIQFRPHDAEVSRNYPLSIFPALDDAGLANDVNEAYRKAIYGQALRGDAPEIFKTSITKDDLAELTTDFQPMVIGLMKPEVHVLNSLVFPTVITDDTTFRLHIMEWLHTVPTETPEFGTGRTIQKTEHMVEKTLNRFSINFYVSYDVQALKAGKIDAMYSLEHIAGGICANLAYMGMEEALNAHPYEELPIYSASADSAKLRANILDRRNQFTITVKEANGFNRAILRAKRNIVKRTGYKGDFVGFMPSDKRSLLANNPLYTRYDQAGPNGPKRLFTGFQGFAEVEGVEFYEAPELPSDTRYEYSQLRMPVRVGEYAFLRRMPNLEEDETGNFFWNLLDSHSDRFSPIDARSCVEKCGFFIPTENTRDSQDPRDVKYMIDYDTISETAMTDGPDLAMHERAFYNSDGEQSYPNNLYSWSLTELLNVFGFYAIRALGGAYTKSMVIMAPGEDTGITACSEGRISVGDDAMSTTQGVNWTGWGGVIIKQPDLIEVIHDAFPDGLIHGMNTVILDKQGLADLKLDELRLDNETSPCVMIMPVELKKHKEQQFMFTQGYDPFQQNRNEASASYPYVPYMCRHFGFAHCDGYIQYNDAETGWSIAPQLFASTIGYSTKNGQYRKIPGQTCWGLESEGCGVVRQHGETMNPGLDYRASMGMAIAV